MTLGLAMDQSSKTISGKRRAADKEAVATAIELLKRHRSFSVLGDAALADIARRCHIDRFGRGDVAFRQGDEGDYAFLVLSGELAVEVETEHGRVRVAEMGPGDLVGEIAAFATVPRTASLEALTDSQLLRLEQTVIKSLIAEHPEAAMAVVAGLGERLQNLNETIATLTQATSALAAGEFRPAMLETLKNEASRFRHFAGVFESMAAEITQKRMLNQEMETAAEIQRSFLPRSLDLGRYSGRCDVFASMIPAKHVGGDFYDFFTVDDRYLAFAIGDVSGKGVPAAIFMSLSRTVLKTIAVSGAGPAEVLMRTNRLLAEENAESMFVTLFFARLDLETGLLEYSSGGHDEVFLLGDGEGPVQLEHLGPAVGLFGGVEYSERSVQLAPGDFVLLATDGVTEAFNRQEEVFGFERLTALLSGCRPDTAQDLVSKIESAVDRFADGAPRSDDTTTLAVRFSG